MTPKPVSPSAVRLFILAAVVLAMTVLPAPARAEEFFRGNCGAQLTATPGQNAATFTIRCASGVQGLRFTATEGALIVPPAVQPSGSNPTHGFPCLPSGGTPTTPEFTCQSGPPPLGSPGLAANEVGTISLQTMNPCGSSLAITDLIVDTGPQGDEATPPSPPESDAAFTRDIPVQCGSSNGGTGNGGTSDRCDSSSDSNSEACICQNDSADDGDFVDDDNNGVDDRCEGFERTREGTPRGGVDSGLGGMAKSREPKRVSVMRSLLGGSALLVFGLIGGGVALARRP